LIYSTEDFKSIRISDTLGYQSAVLSIFDIQCRRFQKYQNFWYFGLPVCNVKYIWDREDFKSIRISDTLRYLSAVLSTFDIQCRGFQKYQNFWYFGLPVCNFRYIWDRKDFKSVRISDTLDYQSAMLSIFDIQHRGFQKY
jgi:hypothetical protein